MSNTTFLDLLRRQAQQQPEKTAVETADGACRLTYSELLQRMEQRQPLPLPLLGDSWDSDFLLRTTGSTGKPKEVIVSQRAVIANSENLIEGHGYSKDTVFLITGPMDHLGSWSKIFPTLIAGGTLRILPGGMRDVEAFLRSMDDKEGEYATFLVPSGIRILLQQAADKLPHYAGRISFIEAGGAPLPHPDMLQLCQLLPHSRLFNTYASTETGVIATYNYNDGRCLSGCLGKPLKHSQFFITPEGTIACKGQTLMSGYQGEPELTATVMNHDTVFTADGGWTDEEGMLHIEGRRDDIINVGGLKVAPTEIEEAALTFTTSSGERTIAECICTAQPHPILGQAPRLLYVAASNDVAPDHRALARFLASKLERYKVPLSYQQVSEIKKTPNGKADRKAYKTK